MAPPRVMSSQCVPLFLRALQPDQRARLRAEYGLPEDAARQVELSVSLRTLTSFSEDCARAAGDPLFGFHQALAVERGGYGLLEFVARHSPDLQTAIERLARYSTLVNELVTIEFVPLPGGRGRTLRHLVNGTHGGVGAHCNEYFVALILHIIRQMVGEDLHPSKVCFAHAARPGTAELEAWLHAPVLFDTGVNELQFSTASLARPVLGADAPLFKVLDEQAGLASGARPQRLDRLTQRVSAAIPEALQQGGSALERVATRFHMSGRSLQRYLDQEGVKFAELVEVYRRSMGVRLIAENERPIGEVAFVLGYAELRSFTRAYRRWTGVTPGAARQDLKVRAEG